jgi:hypothetical protein
MKVSVRAINPPPHDFDAVVKKTLETFQKEFQQILSNRTPYFESAQQSEVSQAQQPIQSSHLDDDKSLFVIVVSVCGGIVAVLALAMLVRKGHRSRGTSTEALATLVDDGVAVEVFSVGTHRKSLVVEDCESHSSLSSTSAGPQPDSTRRKQYSQRFDTQVVASPTPYAKSPRNDTTTRLVAGTSIVTADTVLHRVPYAAERMASFSTGVCSQESDLFGRSYKDGAQSSDGDSRRLDVVESSTTGSRVSMGYDDGTHILHSLAKRKEEGSSRFTWTRKILGFGFGAGVQSQETGTHKATTFTGEPVFVEPFILEIKTSETRVQESPRLTWHGENGEVEFDDVDLGRPSNNETRQVFEDIQRLEQDRKEIIEPGVAAAPVSPRVQSRLRSTDAVVEKYRDYTMATQRQRSTAELPLAVSTSKRSSSSLAKPGLFNI